MDIKKEFISPERAKLMLNKNYNNRTLSKDAVDQFIRDMRNGEWKFTHQSILLGDDDCVIDGQHRLVAIARSGIGQWSLVARDKSLSSARDLPIDVGVKRRTAFILGTNTAFASMLTYAFKVCRGITTPSFADIKSYIPVFEGPYAQVTKDCKVHRRMVTIAPVQLAGVVMAMHGADVEYINKTYLSLAYSKFSEMPPFVASFYRQVIVDRSKFVHSELFARAIRVFDSTKKDLTKMSVRDETLAYNEAKQLLQQILEAAR